MSRLRRLQRDGRRRRKPLDDAHIVGAEAVSGKSATAYRYYQAGAIASGFASTKGWVKLWVSSDGLPLKLESDAETKVMFIGGRRKSTILYTDYGAPIRISPPV